MISDRRSPEGWGRKGGHDRRLWRPINRLTAGETGFASRPACVGLGGRYAAALFELAEDRDALDAVALDLHGLSDMIDESADLERLIRSPVLSRDEQGRAIAALAERAGFGPLTRQFLGGAGGGRLFALPDMVAAYDAMLAEHKGEVGAEVISAVPCRRPSW